MQTIASKVLGKTMRPSVCFLLTMCCALGVRVVTYSGTVPNLYSRDGFLYLNAARLLRGDNTSSEFDPIANAPRNATAGRIAYPVFLNVAFALAGWRPTPASVLERMAQIQPRIRDKWHWRFLTMRENLRAVQLMQHLLGLIATALAFWLFWRWTKVGWLAMGVSLLAVGGNRNWLYFEQCILTETLAGTLTLSLIALLEQAHKCRWSVGWTSAALVTSVLLGCTRPNLVFLAPTLFLFVCWQWPECYPRVAWLRPVVLCLIPFVLIVGGWLFGRNVSAYHFTFSPDAFEDPILRRSLREHLARHPNDYDAVYNIVPVLRQRWRVPSWQIGEWLAQETQKALRRRPDVFVGSVLGGLAEHFFYAGVVRKKQWNLLACGLLVFNLVGLSALALQDTPLALRFALFATVLNALLCAVTIGVNADQPRYAFPFLALLSLSVYWMLWHGSQHLLHRWMP